MHCVRLRYRLCEKLHAWQVRCTISIIPHGKNHRLKHRRLPASLYCKLYRLTRSQFVGLSDVHCTPCTQADQQAIELRVRKCRVPEQMAVGQMPASPTPPAVQTAALQRESRQATFRPIELVERCQMPEPLAECEPAAGCHRLGKQLGMEALHGSPLRSATEPAAEGVCEAVLVRQADRAVRLPALPSRCSGNTEPRVPCHIEQSLAVKHAHLLLDGKDSLLARARVSQPAECQPRGHGH